MAHFANYKDVLRELPIINEGFEQCIKAESSSAWMDENATEDRIRWVSNREVRTLTMAFSGYGAAPAECEAYPRNTPSIDTNIYELGISRTVRAAFGEDYIDDFGGEFPVVTEFVRLLKEAQKEELDKYRWSKICQLACTHGISDNDVDFDFDDADSPKALLKDIQQALVRIRAKNWKGEDLVIAINSNLREGILNHVSDIGSCSRVDQSGNLSQVVESIDNVPLISVNEQDFYSLYKFQNGLSGNFGIDVDANASKINYLIMAKRAPIGLVRRNGIDVFGAEDNRQGDGIEIKSKLRHDLLVLNCDLSSLYASLAS